jgi:hypothetical protein
MAGVKKFSVRAYVYFHGFALISQISLLFRMAYNALRVSEVAEGDLREGVSPSQIHVVRRSGTKHFIS